MKKKWKILIDIAMLCLLPLLMAYFLVGEAFHEVIGTGMLLLFLTHHILNRGWYKALFQGGYPPRRVFQTALDALLLVVMLLQPLSGILLSKHLYTFLPALPVSAWARRIHMLLAYWGFVLTCVHTGTHLRAPLMRLKKRGGHAWAAALFTAGAVSVYGCYAFVKRGFPDYLFARTAFPFFDFSEPRALFFLDVLAIMALFAAVGCAVGGLLRGGGQKKGR